MIGLAAMMMTSAAWTQAPAQEQGTDHAGAPGPFQCTVGVTSFSTGKTQMLTAKMKTVDACKTWALDANHLDPESGSYDLLIHNIDGKVVLRQVCTVQGLPILGSARSKFACKDVAA
jgi:hypothetical protein